MTGIPTQFMARIHVLGFCGLLLLGGCVGSYDPTSREDLESDFRSEFGIPAPPQIADIKCRIVRVGDSWAKWMLFSLDETTLRSIITNGGFKQASSIELDGPSQEFWSKDLTRENPNSPKWWRMPGTNRARIYYRQPNRKDFHVSWMSFWVDDNARVVYSASGAFD
jgi:hypothetical protein